MVPEGGLWIMWTARIPWATWQLMIEGKTVEIMLDDGLLTVERGDDDSAVIVRFLTREEAGIRF